LRTVVSDCRIHTPQGRIFARRWSPVVEAATKAPIVLLHDSLGCVGLWRDFPEVLSVVTRRRVIAYDRLGFGRSDPRATRPSLDFIAEEASLSFPAVRRALGIERFVVVGHSVGGGMACHIAARASDACEALVTLSAQAFVEKQTVAGILAAKAQLEDPARVARLAKYHGSKAAWVVDAWTGCWLDPTFATWSLAPVLPRVVCPVLAFHGGSDEYGSDLHPAMIVQGVTGPSRFEILQDAGHMLHRKRPAWVCEQVVDFLGSLP
jgi:pimeloyl-ACP methyl ester carboxylesterase